MDSHAPSRRFARVLPFLILLLLTNIGRSAPVDGVFDYSQPDGSKLPVHVKGDEFFAEETTLAGDLIIQDPVTQYWCYAKVSSDGKSMESTGVVAEAAPASAPPQSNQQQKKRLKMPAEHRARIDQANRQKLGRDHRGRILPLNAPGEGTSAAPAPTVQPAVGHQTLGPKKGITLLIKFPDRLSDASITRTQVEDFCNQRTPHYTEFGNNGSVSEYYYDVSGGKLDYANYVTEYYTARNPRSYYTDDSVSYGTRAKELIVEALNSLDAAGFDFGALSDASGRIIAVNCFYAGDYVNAWAKGLWPHAGSISWRSNRAGVSLAGSYQISNIGDTLALDTFCHENGHMLCGFPDVYDYDGDSSGGTGSFDLMDGGDLGHNPCPPNAYLRYKAGWGSTETIPARASFSRTLTAQNGNLLANQFLIFFNPTTTTEYYLVENIYKNHRYERAPTGGIAVYHVDEDGDHDNQSFAHQTSHLNYEVALIQADNQRHYERYTRGDQSQYLYYSNNTASTYVNEFSDTSDAGPYDNNAHWWSGDLSGLRLYNFSAQGATMTLSISSQGVNPGFRTDKTSLRFTASAGTQAVALTAGVHWTASSDQTWATVLPVSGTASATLSIKAEANPATTSRTAAVTITGDEGSSVSIAITQNGFDGNIAAGKPTLSSCDELSIYPASNATDSNTTTRWSSCIDDNAWLAVDLEARFSLTKVQILWEAAYAAAYEIQTSDDNNTWTKSYSTAAGQGGTETIALTANARYVRFKGIRRASLYGYSIYEFRVYGTPFADLTVDKSTVALPPEGGHATVSITTTLEWAAASSDSWLTCTPNSGNANGTLDIQAPANPATSRQATIQVTASGITRKITVSQAGLPNTPPTIAPIAKQTILVNTSSAAIPFTVGDVETPSDALTIRATSDNVTVVPAGSIQLAGIGSNRTVTITPAANQTGNAAITLTVTDGGGASATTAFTVTVVSPTTADMIDRNNDGISDVWASIYPNVGGPQDDPDGDGVPNWIEAQGGTDPNNPASGFVATISKDIGGAHLLRWPGETGKYYYLETSTNLADWNVIPGFYTGEESDITVALAPSGNRAFWHVVVFDVDSDGSGLNDWEKQHIDHIATVTATAGPNGSITPSGICYVAAGDSISYSAAPDTGFAIDKVLVDGVDAGGAGPFGMPHVLAGTHTISVTFRRVATLTVSPTALQLPAVGGSGNTAITASCTWSASTTANWLSLSPATGNGNGSIAVTASTNSTNAPRTAQIVVAGPANSGISIPVTIQQPFVANVNLAIGKTATASSQESDATLAAFAIDDNIWTRWSSAFRNNEWLSVDLRVVHQISRIEIVWENAYAGAYILQSSADGTTWADLYSTITGKGGTEVIPVIGSGRYVRILCKTRATSYGSSLFEFRIFGAP